MTNTRCGECPNCLELERVGRRVLAVANPPFSHADDGAVELWNAELARLPCTRCPHCGSTSPGDTDGDGDCARCARRQRP